MKKYRIVFKPTDDLTEHLTNDLIINEEFLRIQIEILIESGYRVLSARIVEEN